MAKTKFSIWRYIICEICKKNGSNRPFLASRVADTIFPPPIEGHHRQLDNQCKDPMANNKDCRVGQLTRLNYPLGRNIPPAGNPNMHLQRLSFDQNLSLKSVSILTLEKRYMQNIATATSILQCIIQKICISNALLSIKVCH